ncbi:MAG TPA: ABC transporter ATP-binding protein, partial [Ktedonobacterales bacterium]|nr:ABC transporter ATP-binding protein [Ktedonobacterales bacterium]
EGEVFGFLGPNGAGKTTTMRTLMGLLHASSGTATIGRLDCWSQSTEVKKLVGYLPGELSLDPTLTGAQILTYLGNLRGGSDPRYVSQLCDRLGLDSRKRFREYSHGNKQKVGLVQAFMHRPRLIILDEPTSGLDPLNQQEFYAMVKEVRDDGRTVFLSSHILPEVEQTCDRVGIIREGRLVTVDAVTKLRDLEQHVVEITFAETPQVSWFGGIANARDVRLNGDHHTIHLTTAGELGPIIQVAAQHQATNISTTEPSLEEVFLRYYEPATTK